MFKIVWQRFWNYDSMPWAFYVLTYRQSYSRAYSSFYASKDENQRNLLSSVWVMLRNISILFWRGPLDFPQLFQAPKLFQLNLGWKEVLMVIKWKSKFLVVTSSIISLTTWAVIWKELPDWRRHCSAICKENLEIYIMSFFSGLRANTYV